MTDPHLGRRRFLAGTAATSAALALGVRPAAGAAVDIGGGHVVRPRSEWAATPDVSGIPLEDVRVLVVHHSVGPAGGGGRTPAILRDIHRFHTGAKGWVDVAYNFVVDADGVIWEARSGSLAGPVRGDATGGNQGSSQLCCFLGDLSSSRPTDAAVAAMTQLLAWLGDRADLPIGPTARSTFVSRGSNRHPAGSIIDVPTIAPHRDLTYTACPGEIGTRLVEDELRPAAATLQCAVRQPSAPAEATGQGYWLLRRDGSTVALGGAPDLGAACTGGVPAVDIAAAPGGGALVLDASGTVHALGTSASFGGRPVDNAVALLVHERAGVAVVDANGGVSGDGTLGDLAGIDLAAPIVAAAPTPTGEGYRLLGADGGVFCFGDADFHGSTGGLPLVAPAVGLAPDPERGYRVVAADGGVFAFGCDFRGSMGGVALVAPVVAMAPYGDGYLLVGRDGGVFVFSDEPFLGSAAGTGLADVVAIAPTGVGV